MLRRLRRHPHLFAALVFMGSLFVAGCSDDDSSTGPIDASGGVLFVVQSDFQSGLLEWIGLDNNMVRSGNLSVFRDAVVRVHGGAVYILEKMGADNVMKFDPSAGGASGVVYQQHLGDNWNPSDIDFVSDTKAYVSNQNEPKITIFDPSAGSIVGHIDIADYTFNPDSNTSPYANQMVLADSTLYMMLQRRDGFNPGAPTLILPVDTHTDAIVESDTIACEYKNGFDMVYVDGALYVSNPGSVFATGDGAIERVDPGTKEVTTIITEDDLGGSPNQLVHKHGTRFYVQNYVGWQDVSVVEIDVATGEIVTTIPGIVDAYGGICYDEVAGRLYVGERDAAGIGIRVFEDTVQVAGPIKSASSLPPSQMTILR